MPGKSVSVVYVRLRILRMRDLLTDALESLSGPDPDFEKCGALIDMVSDISPIIDADMVGGEAE